MVNDGKVGDQHHRHRVDEFTGVTVDDKDRAAGRDPADDTAADRMLTAVWNAERVAILHGTGQWTGRGRWLPTLDMAELQSRCRSAS